MADSAFLNDIEGIVIEDTTGGGENVGGGGFDGFNPYATTNNKPATLDISVTGGFLQGTGSVADNLFNDIQHKKGRIFFPSASVEAAIDRTEYPSSRYRIPPRQSRRFEIISNKRIALQRPLELYDFEGDRFVYPELDSSLLQFSMSFENSVVTPATSSTFLGSFADITFGNLRTYSGDIHRMRVYAKHKNDQSEQENRIGDFVVRDRNELIDRNSPSGQAPIGVFYSQSVVDNNWVSSSNCGEPIQKNDSEIMSAVLLSGSNYNDGQFFDFKTDKYIPLTKAQDYIVNFSSYFIKKPKQQSDGSVVDRAQIEVLLSGSVESSNQHLLSLGTISGLGDDSSETLEGKISGSIPNLFNYFTTYGGVGTEPSASLVFRVHAGEFHIGRVAVRPLTFANFHPDSYRVKLPMPKKAQRNQQYDFRVEFFDFDNNKSQFTTESTASIFFTGTNDVLDGLDNHIEGAQLWGNAMEAYGVSGNSAYLRSVGYQGFAKTRDGSGERNGGFMMFSGSIGSRITASEAYQGVGIEIVDASAGSGNPGQHKFLQFRSVDPDTGEARFRVQTDEFYFGQDRTQPAAQFISGSEGKIEISSSNFHLDNDGSIIMQGTITATAGGQIGGFTIGSASMFSGNELVPTFFLSGSGHTGANFEKSNLFISSSGFQVNAQGAMSASVGRIGGFTISETTLANGTDIVLDASNKKITLDNGSLVIDNNSGTPVIRSATNFASGDGFFLSTATSNNFRVGDAGGARLQFTGTDTEIYNSSNAKLVSLGATNEIAGWTINSSTIAKSTDVVLDAGNSKITLGNGGLVIDNNSGTPLIRSATNFTSGNGFFLSSDGSNNFRIGNAGGARLQFTGTNTEIYNSSNSKLVSLGASNTIAGWTIDSDKISSNNLILHSDGFIETTNYASDVKGFFLGARALSDGSVGSFLEVDEAKIRGTLKTTVFEKETVNAVGGQLQVGNSTTITGSQAVGASDTVIQVANASGFSEGEILLIKKFNETGFTTEYVEIDTGGVAREDASSDTNFSGSLTVLRGRGQSPTAGTVSGSIGGTGQAGQTYSPGQVIVSTGKVGTGYIRLNANPNDQATPFMDIVERSGSGVYDVDLKARLGDLSGLSSGLVGTKPGFGLFTEKLFLRAENADSASIAVGGATDINTGNGFFVDGGGNFRVGGTSNNFLKFTGGTLSISVPDIDINSTDFTLDASGIDIESSDATITLGEGNLLLDGGNSIIKIGATTNKQVLIEGSSTVGKIYTGKTDVSQTTAGFWIANNDGDPEFHVGDAAEFIKFDGGALSIKSSDIDITATTFNLNANSGDLLIDSSAKTISLDGGTITLDGSGTGFLDIGNLTGVTDTASSNKGLYATGDGTLLLKAAANEFLQINNSKLSASFNSLDINTSTFDVSTANGGKLSLGSATTFGTAGVFMSGSGGVSFYQDANNYFIMTGSIMDIRSQEFNLVTTGSGGTPDKGIIMNSTQPLIMVSGSRGSVKGNSVRLLGDEGVLEVSQSGEGVFDTGRTKTFTEFTTVEFDSVRPLSFGGVDKPDVITTSGSIQAAPRMDNLDVDGVIDTVGLNTNRINVVGAGVGRADIFFKNTSPQFAMDENAATDPKPHFIFLDENDTSFAEPPNVFGNQHPSFVFHKTISGSHATDQVPVGYRSGSSGALPESGSSIFTISTTMTAQNAGDIADAQFNLLALDTNLSGIDNQHQNEYTFLQARHSGSIRAQLQHDGDFISKGNITAFGTTFLQVSDQRLKKDIHTISGSMNKILQLRPTEFTWIDNDKQDVGFIAQEVEEIIPEVIEISDGFINTVNDQQIKTISYPKLVPYLVDTIQQLTKRIEELEKKVK